GRYLLHGSAMILLPMENHIIAQHRSIRTNRKSFVGNGLRFYAVHDQYSLMPVATQRPARFKREESHNSRRGSAPERDAPQCLCVLESHCSRSSTGASERYAKRRASPGCREDLDLRP